MSSITCCDHCRISDFKLQISDCLQQNYVKQLYIYYWNEALLRGEQPPGNFLENFPEKSYLPLLGEPEKFLSLLKGRLEDLPWLTLGCSKTLEEFLGPFWTSCRGKVRTLASARSLKVRVCRAVSEETLPGAVGWREVALSFLPRAVNDLAEFLSPC